MTTTAKAATFRGCPNGSKSAVGQLFYAHSWTQVIKFASPELALAETYVWYIQRYPPEARESLIALTNGAHGEDGRGMDLMACVRYVDRVEKRDGQWRIAKRTAVAHWKTVQPFWQRGTGSVTALEHWPARYERSLYRERAAIGLAPTQVPKISGQ